MRNMCSLMSAISLSLLAFGPTGALAASPGSADCTTSGGVYEKTGPTATCVYPSQPVANPNANPNNNSQTTQDTTTGQGNLGNKTQNTCTGPKGQCR
jgi:hypothetical protein